MWTVDTWCVGNIKYELMDEGYTERIITPDTIVTCYYNNNIVIEKGNEETLLADYNELLKFCDKR